VTCVCQRGSKKKSRRHRSRYWNYKSYRPRYFVGVILCWLLPPFVCGLELVLAINSKHLSFIRSTCHLFVSVSGVHNGNPISVSGTNVEQAHPDRPNVMAGTFFDRFLCTLSDSLTADENAVSSAQGETQIRST
jgi:hypothetical protein